MEDNISLKQFTKKVQGLVNLLQERDAQIALLEAEKEELRKEIEKIKALIESNSATIKELTAVDYIEKNAKKG